MSIGRDSRLVGILVLLVVGCYDSTVDGSDDDADVAPDADQVDSAAEDGATESADCCGESDDGPPDGEDGTMSEADDVVMDETVDADGEADAPVCPEGMALVPAGAFVMGADPEEALVDDEMPEHVVTLSRYCIDIDETTEDEHEACVDVAICTRAFDSGEDAPMPVRGVRWGDAWAYCAWRGKRLPTEAEWEKAARGGCEVEDPPTCGPEDERVYPWGDAPPAAGMARLCFEWVERWQCDYRARPGPVGSWPDDTSPYGVHDMLGNVREWVADWWDAAAYQTCADGCFDPTGPATGEGRVVRGNQSATLPAEAALTRRGGWWPDIGESSTNAGIRCAFTPEP